MQSVNERVTLGERTFHVLTDSTIRHDHWMAAQLQRAGIAHAHLDAGMSPAAFADALVDQLMASGMATVILAGFLLPDGLTARDWTPDIAAECAAYIDGLMAPDDKATVRGITAGLVAGFFRSGLASLTTSPTASRPQTMGVSLMPEPVAIGGP